MIYGIVATHAGLGHELIRTAERIAGPQEGLIFVSNEGLSVEALSVLMGERIEQCAGASGIIVMTDVPGGSCAVACRALGPGPGQVWVVTGVNLPMILAFIQYRSSMGPEELARAVAARSIRAIEVVE